MIKDRQSRNTPERRRGAVGAFALVSMVALLGMLALAVDTGRLYVARAQLQTSADAAALAGAMELLTEGHFMGPVQHANVLYAARQQAASVAAQNAVLRVSPGVGLNAENSPGGDVVLGYLSDPQDVTQSLDFSNPNQFNAVAVRVSRNESSNGSIALFFAPMIGINDAGLSAQATAAYDVGIIGYQVTEETGPAELLPLALHVDAWNALRDGSVTTGDDYAYDPDTGAVTEGSDGILELNLYPGAGADQLPPGNFGTVDVGSPDNSTADISRQVVYGVNEQDLSYFGGELSLAGGPVQLNGDTGLSAAIKDELASVIGLERAIPIFDDVHGPGDNAMFRMVGFEGIRILHVKLTGAPWKKQVIIQPALVVDDAGIGDAASASEFVRRPVRLVR